MRSVGTLDWAEHTDGRLRARDYLTLAAQAVALQTRVSTTPMLERLAGKTRPPTTLATLDVPETEAARTALAICEEHSPQYFVEHGLRTYFWAKAFAQRDDISHDDEVLFVASLLHDLGLTANYAVPQHQRGCFTIGASRTAQMIASTHHWSPTRARAVAEAITLHLNPRVSIKQGPEAHLVAAGAACDVVGIRAGQVSEATRDVVLALHPRQQLKSHVISDLRLHGDAPRTRARFLLTAGQIEHRVRRSIYTE